MVKPEKYKNSLYALQYILIKARAMAYEQGAKDLAKLLDWAEIFPFLIGCDSDETETVRKYLAGVVEDFPHCTHALKVFDDDTPPIGWEKYC
jgi:hypothetical protein